eukprot:jgi/Mesen1/9744/ME000695S09045
MASIITLQAISLGVQCLSPSNVGAPREAKTIRCAKVSNIVRPSAHRRSEAPESSERHLFPKLYMAKPRDDSLLRAMQQESAARNDEQNDAMTTILDDAAYATGTRWINEDYLQLSMRSYQIIKDEAQHALQHHFEEKAPAVTPQQVLHSCCAMDANHTFFCGHLNDVSHAVSPACIWTDSVKFGTTHT